MTASLSKQLKPVKIAICFLTVSPWSDSSKAGVCLYLGRFSIFALFLHTAEHYFVSIVLQAVFHLQGFVVFSLSRRLSLSHPLTSWLLLSFPSLLFYTLILYCTVTVTAGLDHIHNYPPSPTVPPTSNYLPHNPPSYTSTDPSFNSFLVLLLSFLSFLLLLLLYPTGLEIFPLFLTSVLFSD